MSGRSSCGEVREKVLSSKVAWLELKKGRRKVTKMGLSTFAVLLLNS